MQQAKARGREKKQEKKTMNYLLVNGLQMSRSDSNEIRTNDMIKFMIRKYAVCFLSLLSNDSSVNY